MREARKIILGVVLAIDRAKTHYLNRPCFQELDSDSEREMYFGDEEREDDNMETESGIEGYLSDY